MIRNVNAGIYEDGIYDSHTLTYSGFFLTITENVNRKNELKELHGCLFAEGYPQNISLAKYFFLKE